MKVEEIRLSEVIPDPIEHTFQGGGEVWKSTLEINQGQRVVVAADSGKGKSTLLNILYGLRKDYSGRITFNNQDISRFSTADWSAIRQRDFSIVFQDLRLFQDHTCRENLDVSAELHDYYHKSLEEEAIEIFQVGALMKKKAGNCSYGERQRIAIIRAICRPYRWLYLDEPFSHLDQTNIDKACALIGKSLQHNNAGFLLASLGFTYNLDVDRTLYI